MTENSWIEDAFREANERASEAAPIAERIQNFLDDNIPRILDSWGAQVGKEATCRVAVIMSEGDNADLFAEMMKCFTVAGYLLAKHDYENQ